MKTSSYIRINAIVIAAVFLCSNVSAAGTDNPDTSTKKSSPMQKLDVMKGVWIGEAKGTGRDGKPFTVTQTERVGAMLNGDILAVEGRGYKTDGALAFNAFGVISFDARSGNYEFRAYNQWYSGTYRMEVSDTGIIWEMPASANAIIRYTITIKDNLWHELGEYLVKDQPPRMMTELNLKRIADTDWPAANPIKP